MNLYIWGGVTPKNCAARITNSLIGKILLKIPHFQMVHFA